MMRGQPGMMAPGIRYARYTLIVCGVVTTLVQGVREGTMGS